MPTHNVEELFHQFMQDPEYIGKEELALAEAKQRVIQSMNNHKALSMAKMDSPLDDLTNFLLQKGDNDFWHHKTGHNGPSHIVSTEVKETTFEELIDHAKEELLALTPKGTTWEQLMSDPEKVMSYFEEATKLGILSGNESYMSNLVGGFAGSGAIQGILPDREDPNPDAFRREIPKGQDALNELGNRALDNTDAVEAVSKLKNNISFFNANQQNSMTDEGASRQDPGERGLSFQSVHGANQFVPPRGTPDGEIFSPDQSRWKAALIDVMSPDNDWNDSAHDSWNDQVVNEPQNDKERAAQVVQGKVITLAHILTGKLYANPKDALQTVQDIHSRPEQFLATDEMGTPNLRRATDTGTGGKTFVPNIKSSDTQEYEDTRHDALRTIAAQIDKVVGNRDNFFHPPVPQRQEYDQTLQEQIVDDSQGKGWYHSQPLSPMQRWILENAHSSNDNVSDLEAQDKLRGEIARRYNRTQDYDVNDDGVRTSRDAHGTAKGLETLISDIVREQGLQVPNAPQGIMDAQDEWPLDHTYNRVATRDKSKAIDTASPVSVREDTPPGEVTITPVTESLDRETLGEKDPDQLADMEEKGTISEAEYFNEMNARWKADPQSLRDWVGKKVFFSEEGNTLLVDKDNQSSLTAMTRLDPATGKAYTVSPDASDPNDFLISGVEEGAGKYSFGRGGSNLANVKFENAVNVKNVGTSAGHWNNHERVITEEAAGKGVSLTRQAGDEHYASPFTFKDALDDKNSLYDPNYDEDKGQQPAHKVFDTPEEATEAYSQWLRGTTTNPTDENPEGTNYLDVEPERRQWILDQIEQGELDGKEILYPTDEHNTSKRDSDADVLALYINSGQGAGRAKLRYSLADEDEHTEKDSMGQVPKPLRLGQRPMPELPDHLYDDVPDGHVGLADEPTHTQYGGSREPQVSMNLGYAQRGNIPLDKLSEDIERRKGLDDEEGNEYQATRFPGEEDLIVKRDDLQNYLHHRNFMGQMLELGIPLESLSTGLKDGTRQWSIDAMERGMQDHGLLQHGETIFQRNFRMPGKSAPSKANPTGKIKNIMDAGVPPIFPKTGQMPDSDGKPRGNSAQTRRDAIQSALSPQERAALQKEMEKEWVSIHGGRRGYKPDDPPQQNQEYPYHWEDENPESSTFGKILGEDPPSTSTGNTRPAPSPQRDFNTTKPTYTTNEGGFQTSQYVSHVIREEVKRKGREGQPEEKYDEEGNRMYRQQDFSPHTGLPISGGDNFDEEYAAKEKAFVDNGGTMPTPPSKIEGTWDRAELATYRARVVQALGPHPRKLYENSLRDDFEKEYAGKEVDYNHVMEHFKAKGVDAPDPTTLPMGRTLPGGGGISPSDNRETPEVDMTVMANKALIDELRQLADKDGTTNSDIKNVAEKIKDSENSSLDDLFESIIDSMPANSPDDAPVEQPILDQLDRYVTAVEAPAAEEQPEGDDLFTDDGSDAEEGDDQLPEDTFEATPLETAESDHGTAEKEGWGGTTPHEDHFEGKEAEGDQKGSQGYAHDVKAYATANHTADVPLIGANGEPHDDIYDRHNLGDEDSVTIKHVQDHIKESTGKDAPKADWEKDEEQPEATPDPAEEVKPTDGTTPPTPPTPPTAEAAKEPEDDDSEEEDQEALEAEEKKAAKEELDRNNQIVIDTHKGIDEGKSFTEKEKADYKAALDALVKGKNNLPEELEGITAGHLLDKYKDYVSTPPQTKAESEEETASSPDDVEPSGEAEETTEKPQGGASSPPEVGEGEESFDPTPKDTENPNPNPYTIVDKDDNEVYTEGESGNLPMQAEDGEPLYRKYKNADGGTVTEELLPPDTEEDQMFDEHEGIIRGVNVRGGYSSEEEEQQYSDAIDYMETMHNAKDADGVSDAEKSLSESRAKIARGHAENADRYLERLEGKTPTPTPTATPRPTPRARTDAEPRFKGGERRGGENLREGLTTDKLAEDHPGHPNNWPNFTTKEKKNINNAGGSEAFLKALEHAVESNMSSDRIKDALDLPRGSKERVNRINDFMKEYNKAQNKNKYGEVDQKEIRSQIPPDLDPTASRREATEQLRNVVGQAHQLSLLGGTDKAAYTNHIQKLQKLADDAMKAGADDELIKKEALEHTKFPEREAPPADSPDDEEEDSAEEPASAAEEPAEESPEEPSGTATATEETPAETPAEPEAAPVKEPEPEVDHLQEAVDTHDRLSKIVKSGQKIASGNAGIPKDMLEAANDYLQQAQDAPPNQQHDLIARANRHLEDVDRYYLGNSTKEEHPIATATPQRELSPHSPEELQNAKADMLEHIKKQESVMKGAVAATNRGIPQTWLNKAKESIEKEQTDGELHQALQQAHEGVQNVQKYYNDNLYSGRKEPKLKTPEEGEPVAAKPKEPEPEAAPTPTADAQPVADKDYSSEIEGDEGELEIKPTTPDEHSEYTPTREQAKQIKIIQGRIANKHTTLNAEGIKFSDAQEKFKDIAYKLRAKQENNEDISVSEDREHGMAKQAAQKQFNKIHSLAKTINKYHDEIAKHNKPPIASTSEEAPQPESETEQEKPEEERTDGVLQPTFGSREHLADAQKYHDRVDSHTAEYKSLFAPGSQKAVDAWADPHYHPNARAIQQDSGSNSGKYEFHKYDYDKGETSVEQSHERDTNIPNRQNSLSEDSVSTPPHVLGLSQKQQQEYSSIHTAVQNASGDSTFKGLAKLDGNNSEHSALIDRAVKLGDSLKASGHSQEGGSSSSLLNHPDFGANSTNLHTGTLSGDSSFEKSPEGHHFVPDVGHVNTAYINHIQSKLEPGDAFHHTGVATDDKSVSEAGKKSLVSNPDGTPTGKGVMVTKNGVHAVGSIMGEEHTHETHGPISNQHIRETDVANGLHVATGAATGEKHSNVTQHPDGFHIKNVSKTMTDSGSHFGTANPPAKEVTPSPIASAATTAGTALSRLAAKTAGAVKPAADAAARAYTQGDNFKPEAVQEQTFGKVAKRGLASLLGKLPGTEGLSTKLTGMTPKESSAETESLQKLLKFVKSVK